jgi:hypothetical protein
MGDLRKALEDLADELTLVPDDELVGVYSFDYCEDGCALLMLEVAGGAMLTALAEPGRPLVVQLHGGMF